MAISWDLYGTSFSFLQSIVFLEENFLGNLSKLSPDLFVRGLELTRSRNLREGIVDSEIDFADYSSVTEAIKSKMEIRDIYSSALSMFFEQAPFPVLLNEIMSMDISCVPEFPRLAELLLQVWQPKSDSIESDIRLILFWLFQIRSSYKIQPASVLCRLSEICLRLLKHLFSQISERGFVSGPSSDKLVAPFAKWKHQVAQTVLCHPVVMALLESPLDCGTLPPVHNVKIFSETSLTTSRLVICEIDQHILDLLVSICEHFLFDERHIVQEGDLRENKSSTVFKDLVQRLLLLFRDKFELCVGSQSYAPLLQPSQLIHALLRFISPFKILELARSMLSKIDEEELASPNSSMIISLGLDIAGGAFEMLISYSHLPAAKRGLYDLLWELKEENYDSILIEEVYSMACRFSTSFGLVSADTCLLKVGSSIFRGKHNRHCNVHPLTVIISQIVGRTPKDLIIHYINQPSMTRAKILFYLVESSPLHLEIDLELYKLMHDIELIEDEQRLNVSETDYLWGKAALKIREGLRFSQDAYYGGEAGLVENLQQILFKENLWIDPKICAQTLLYFPYQRTAEVSDNSYISDDPVSEKCSPVIERYDPAYILPFSIHSLSMGCIEPVKFASSGLLAVALASTSSADLGMRKLGYETLGIFVHALK
ncbi:unnamed protein product, partial [Arabidopsis lyrata]